MYTCRTGSARAKAELNDSALLRVARRVSAVIALFSFVVAPLLQFAPDGLWQGDSCVFTGFYNIPIIAIVIVGLFSLRVPALGPKVVIGFHLIAYGLLQFVFKDAVDVHFLHLYAILFVVEMGATVGDGVFHAAARSLAVLQQSSGAYGAMAFFVFPAQPHRCLAWSRYTYSFHPLGWLVV